MSDFNELPRVALLHGAGYVGGQLIRLLDRHPGVRLTAVTSSTFAGQPVSEAHPALRGTTDRAFSEHADLDAADALVTAAAHGQSARELPPLLADGGFDGAVVDLSADFRHGDPARYETWYDYEHPAPELLDTFAYGLTEVRAPYRDTQRVANPGCFATGLALALWPLARHGPKDAPFAPAVTALTGASGSGARPSSATHFPDRAGNVRAYKVFAHQHQPEVIDVLDRPIELAFTPASGPWSRGIWGTAHLALPDGFSQRDVDGWFADAYGTDDSDAPLVRTSPGALPELHPAARTPFCDVGWMVKGDRLVVGFALDNLLKGAASQAVQNLNLLLGLPETMGLLEDGGGPRTADGSPSKRKRADNPTNAHASNAAA